MTEISPTRPAKAPDPPYETQEVSASGFGWFVVLLAIYIGLVLLFVAWLLGDLTQREDAARPAPSPLALPQALPPEPRLQPSPGHPSAPWQDLAQLHQTEDQTLNHYGWVDRAHGIAHIPIDRALDLVLKQRLLDRESTTQPRSRGAAP